MSRHQYQSFMFVNPVISSWNHDTLDQADGSGICQHTMTIEYETVFYKSGGTGDDCPIGFSSECYDHRTSPLGPGPNYKDSSNITDIVGGIEGIVGGVLNGNLGSFEGLLQTGATIYGVVQSASNYNGSTNPDVGQNMLEVAGGSVGINGIPNMSFPKSQADTTNTQQNATPSAVPSTQTVESSGSDSEASHQFAFKNAFEPSILKSGLSVDKAKELWSNLTTEQKGNFYNVAVNMINTKSTFDLSNVMNSMDVTVNKTI
jgi:hypothetical protein